MQVIISVAEHHANIVPWQLAAKRTGAVLRHVPLRKDSQEIDVQVALLRSFMHSLLSLFWGLADPSDL